MSQDEKHLRLLACILFANFALDILRLFSFVGHCAGEKGECILY